MNNRVALLSVVVFGSLLSTTANAASVSDEEEALASRPSPSLVRPWTVRAEGGLVNMRDNWLGLPGLEVGLTVGRDLTRWFSVELTGNARDIDQSRGSWSAMAVGRAVVVANHTRHHALTVAAGPFVELATPSTAPFPSRTPRLPTSTGPRSA